MQNRSGTDTGKEIRNNQRYGIFLSKGIEQEPVELHGRARVAEKIQDTIFEIAVLRCVTRRMYLFSRDEIHRSNDVVRLVVKGQPSLRIEKGLDDG